MILTETTYIEKLTKIEKEKNWTYQFSVQKNNKIGGEESIQGFKGYKKQSLLTQARRSEEVVTMVPIFKKGHFYNCG